MNRTSPNKFPKLDLSPEKLNVTKIPQININLENTQLLSDRELHAVEVAEKVSEVGTLIMGGGKDEDVSIKIGGGSPAGSLQETAHQRTPLNR